MVADSTPESSGKKVDGGLHLYPPIALEMLPPYIGVVVCRLCLDTMHQCPPIVYAPSHTHPHLQLPDYSKTMYRVSASASAGALVLRFNMTCCPPSTTTGEHVCCGPSGEIDSRIVFLRALPLLIQHQRFLRHCGLYQPHGFGAACYVLASAPAGVLQVFASLA